MERFDSKNYMKMGIQELQKLYNLQLDNSRKILERLISNYGFICERDYDGNIEDDWKPAKKSDTIISIQPGKGILNDQNGEIVFIENTEEIEVTIPNVEVESYKLFIKPINIANETGTVSLANGSITVLGTGTKFLDVYSANKRIIIEGNLHYVTQVRGNEELEISEMYTGVNIVDATHQVGAWIPSYPSSIEDNTIYLHDTFEIGLVTRELVTGEYLLADIEVSSYIITSVVDNRGSNILKYRNDSVSIDYQNSRERRVTIWKPEALCATGVNDDAAEIVEHIKADDTHAGTFSKKMIMRFYKRADDKNIHLAFNSFYTAGGELSAADKSKYQVRMDIDESEGIPAYLSQNVICRDISELENNRYYEMSFLLCKVDAAYNLSIRIDEVYLTGNKILIV